MTDALPEAARKAGRFAWRWVIPIVMFALVTVIVAYHSRDELRPGVAWLQRVAGEIQDQSMFGVAEEIQAQVHLAGPAPPFPLNVILAGLETAPQLPGALFHVLAARWVLGGLEFMIGVTFVAAYLTVMVFGFRQNLYVGLFAIVFGPFPVAAAFWLLQHALTGLAAWLSVTLTCAVACGGAPGMCWLCLAHGALSLRHAAKDIGHGVDL